MSSRSEQNHIAMPAKPDLVRLIIGIFGVGSSGPLIALSSMPVPALVFWRNLGGSIVTAPFGLRHKIDKAGAKLALLAGVVLALHFMGFFLSMRLTSVTAGTAIAAMQPIFAALFIKFTGGDIPSNAWLGMFISFVGVLLVTGVDLQLDSKAFLGDLAALLCGALAAIYMMIGARAQKTLEATSYTTICYFACAVTALPIALASGTELIAFAGREWLILGGLLLGAQLLGHTMFNTTLKRVSPAVVSMIVFFEVPVAALIAALFHIGKQPSITVIPAVALILIGCAIVVLRTRPENVMTEE